MLFKSSLYLLVLSCFFASYTLGEIPVPFEDCGCPGGDVKGISMMPEVPHAGDDIMFTVSATTARKITGGTMTLRMYRKVFSRNIRFFQDRKPISELVTEGETLPMEKNQDVKLRYSLVSIPFVPRGSYYVEIRAADENSSPLVCLNMICKLRSTLPIRKTIRPLIF